MSGGGAVFPKKQKRDIYYKFCGFKLKDDGMLRMLGVSRAADGLFSSQIAAGWLRDIMVE
jgi:hypothetical protein